jgi:hypothetical protein
LLCDLRGSEAKLLAQDTEHTLSTLQHVAAIALRHGHGQDAGSAGAAGVTGDSGILQTEATKVARRVLTTNVPMARELQLAAETGHGATAGAAGTAAPGGGEGASIGGVIEALCSPLISVCQRFGPPRRLNN